MRKSHRNNSIAIAKAELEKQMLANALRSSGGSLRKAGDTLGLSYEMAMQAAKRHGLRDMVTRSQGVSRRIARLERTISELQEKLAKLRAFEAKQAAE